MPSGRAKRQLDPTSFEFFLDRGLGRYDVAEMLRSRGHVAHAMAVRMVSLDSSKLTGDQMAARFEFHLNRIIQRCNKPGPFFDVLHATNIERRYP